MSDLFFERSSSPLTLEEMLYWCAYTINHLLGLPHMGPPGQVQPRRDLRIFKPYPSPWLGAAHDLQPWLDQNQASLRSKTAVTFLLSNISIKVAAAHMPAGDTRDMLLQTTQTRISEFIDSFCVTPASVWPLSGPSPWILQAVSELTLLAGTIQEGGLRVEIEQAAAQILEKSYVSVGNGAASQT